MFCVFCTKNFSNISIIFLKFIFLRSREMFAVYVFAKNRSKFIIKRFSWNSDFSQAVSSSTKKYLYVPTPRITYRFYDIQNHVQTCTSGLYRHKIVKIALTVALLHKSYFYSVDHWSTALLYCNINRTLCSIYTGLLVTGAKFARKTEEWWKKTKKNFVENKTPPPQPTCPTYFYKVTIIMRKKFIKNKNYFILKYAFVRYAARTKDCKWSILIDD